MTRRQLRPLGRRARDEVGAAYARAALPNARTPWRLARWCTLDFELTGLDPREDEIVSFGAIPIEGARVRLAEAVSGLVQPTRELPDASIRVHGIRPVDLARAPSLEESIATLLPAITGRTIVAHTAAIERTFLAKALARRRLRLRGRMVDVVVLGQLWLYQRERTVRRHVSLADLAAELGLPAERPHTALGDALTTAQVFIALASHLDAIHPETVGSLARADRRVDALRLYQPG